MIEVKVKAPAMCVLTLNMYIMSLVLRANAHVFKIFHTVPRK